MIDKEKESELTQVFLNLTHHFNEYILARKHFLGLLKEHSQGLDEKELNIRVLCESIQLPTMAVTYKGKTTTPFIIFDEITRGKGYIDENDFNIEL